MHENKIVAAILTVAYNSAFVRDTIEPETVMRTYETFQTPLQQRDDEESEASIPDANRPSIDEVRKKAAARQNRAS